MAALPRKIHGMERGAQTVHQVWLFVRCLRVYRCLKMEHDWAKVYDRLSTLDAEALVRIAIAASAAVQAEWERDTPGPSDPQLIEVAAVLNSWVATGEVHARIKDMAAAAYATLGASELPGSLARRSGLAVAHAAFALYFWTLRNKGKVFSAARDAVGHALAASSDPLLEERLLRLAKDGAQM